MGGRGVPRGCGGLCTAVIVRLCTHLAGSVPVRSCTGGISSCASPGVLSLTELGSTVACRRRSVVLTGSLRSLVLMCCVIDDVGAQTWSICALYR